MTFDQIRIFVAVAERGHLTQAAAALNLSPSAVSASIKALEGFYNVRLFARVGRGIELTREGIAFLPEAREMLSRVASAELVLSELGGLKRGSIDIHASQTIINHWLPTRLMRFHESYPDIELHVIAGNTRAVCDAVIRGAAELGFIEGKVASPLLSLRAVAHDDLVVVVAPNDDMAALKDRAAKDVIGGVDWVVREPGSGTRSEFEAALRSLDFDPAELRLAMTLPSNEAVLSVVLAGNCAAALSKAVVKPFVANGELIVLDVPLRPRKFTILWHKERHLSAASSRLAEMCYDGGPL